MLFSMTNVDLPPPDTPVTHRNLPRGNFTSTDLRLLPVAPIISRFLPLPFRLIEGTGIDFFHRFAVDEGWAKTNPAIQVSSPGKSKRLPQSITMVTVLRL